MRRRCVICGIEPPSDACGKRTFHYPKTKKEARIWQRSLNAHNIPVDAIQKYCCVCIEHIPQFVQETQNQAAKFKCCTGQTQNKNGDLECCCERGPSAELPEGFSKPAVNVLLMTGASLPSYCGKSCHSDEKKKSKVAIAGSETDICVLESNFSDGGAKFPDIDTTEFTVLRTPTQDDVAKKQEEEAAKDECLRDCTDVLLLGRGRHPTDECPCNCDHCLKPQQEEAENCCKSVCCPPLPQPPPRQDHPPCGCECEQQVRYELNQIIEDQQARIRQLEDILNRQTTMHQTLQCKIDDLYSEFNRMSPDTTLHAPEKHEPAPEESLPREEEHIKKGKRKKHKKSLTPPKEHRIMRDSDEDIFPTVEPFPTTPLFRRVQYYLGKNPKARDTDSTKSCNWLETKDDQIAKINNEAPLPTFQVF
ncbi:uncharacterized protein LOC115625244 [Scaptodrosophila lebanonensis]|uniref:Uncharacterized protein LOC115625244 n=1 Tax=Drosophila lebanonensis TaxID=7225 RepID=A0A6J2TKS6_DROLE|nr:uncharacterized protein LOC115625244 [Scaptodrosophila lebanonensis]